MILIMKRDYYKTVQMASFFKKMRIRWDFILIITFESQIRRLRTISLKILISVDMAGTVDPETLRRCISLWVMYYLTPKFCIVDLNSFVLTDAGELRHIQGAWYQSGNGPNWVFRWSIQGKNKLQSTWSIFGFDYSRWSRRFDYQAELYQT